MAVCTRLRLKLSKDDGDWLVLSLQRFDVQLSVPPSRILSFPVIMDGQVGKGLMVVA